MPPRCKGGSLVCPVEDGCRVEHGDVGVRAGRQAAFRPRASHSRFEARAGISVILRINDYRPPVRPEHTRHLARCDRT
jgi:hypothetical protein